MPDTTRPRREFLSDTFAAATSFGIGAAFMGLGQRCQAEQAAQGTSKLQPVKDETTGLPLLRLPEGFRYLSYGWKGDVMTDGALTPAAHDGMAVIKDDNGLLTIARNHEISDDGRCLRAPGNRLYDERARAGCTNLRFDSKEGRFTESFISIAGTSRNCAGGVTPWGTWLTCEETVLGPLDKDKYKNDQLRTFKQTHGWIFEVAADGASDPKPLKDMGRFVHEALAVDRKSGIVYETEDRGTSGFYRFVPNKKGELSAGGTLEIAEVVGQSDLRGGVASGSTFDVRWHKIDDPHLAHSKGTNDELGVFAQGKKKGGSTFARLEGCWYGNGLIYFDATSGGEAKAGQIWQYDPQTEKLSLLFESPSKPVLNMPDNLCVSPRGGILLCEDNDYGANEYPQRVFALSQEGKLELFAQNNVQLKGEKNLFFGDYRTKEWSGANFSPDGKWLFINIQSPGITFAITGPWSDTLA